MENTKLPTTNEKHDQSARMKFPDARFKSPLLIMLKLVAKIQFVYQNMEKKNALNYFFFSNSDNDWKFWWGHFRNKTRLDTVFVTKTRDICAYQQEAKQ